MTDLILLGYIAKAFGIKGGVHTKLINDQSTALVVNSKVTIKQKHLEPRVFTIAEVVPGGRLYFAEINSRDDAEKLQGAEIYMSRGDFPTLSDDEFYLADLIGSQVVLKSQEFVGRLIGFSSNKAQLLLEIELATGYIASVPFVPPIVINIDEKNKIITIDPPLGLLEPLE